MSHLIDATEMYLRTLYELEEEGIRPIRARLVERLHLSAPAVSETVARLEQEGLMKLREDRTVELTQEGRARAVSVMRKHRLAERLLVDVIGLRWDLVHAEACRWEHVISDEVEQRLVEVLDAPTHDAHGNPIPGIGPESEPSDLLSLADAASEDEPVVVDRISEHLQADAEVIARLFDLGLRPGTRLMAHHENGAVVIDTGDRRSVLDEDSARFVYVRPAIGT
ncbi:MAG TPA: metal-dependent transcriptional regulator [Euzebyales bacterium]|nr:metal-dependent transcriptional regulator [Euzebyales bacterium]